MNRWIFNILFLVSMMAIEARAEVPKRCRNNAMLDSILSSPGIDSGWLKNCAEFLNELAAIEIKVKAAMPKGANISVGAGNSQSESLDNFSTATGAGGDIQAQKAKAAKISYEDYTGLVTKVSNRIKKLDDVSAYHSSKLTGIEKENYDTASDNAKNELISIRDEAFTRAAIANNFAAGFKGNASALYNQSDAAAAAAASLKNGETPNTPPPQKSSGVSGNTMVALGGAAVIAAGTVGGIYVVGNQIEKNANKDSKKRIEQAEQAALNVVNAAEQSAKNVIQFASDQANQVLANAEETGQKLIDMAKNNFAEMIPTLSAELSSSMTKLSTERLEKLNSELNAVFDAQIAKATASGDQTLVDNLTKAKASVNKQIEDELKRRHDAILTG